MNEPDAYTIELIHNANEENYYRGALQAADELYRRTKNKLTKKTKARVRNTLALLKAQLSEL